MKYENLITQFKSERKKQKLSQIKVSERCDVSNSAIAKIERLKREPKLNTFIEMCAAIGYMVAILPLPDEMKIEYVEPTPEPIEKKPTDYDNFNFHE